MINLVNSIGAGFLLLGSCDYACAQLFKSQQHDFVVEVVARTLNHPWGMVFLDAESILVTERPGRLRLILNGELQADPIPGLPKVDPKGQGGLMDIALHPGFQDNNLIYLSFTNGHNAHTTQVARGRWANGKLNDTEVIFSAAPRSTGGRHFGSRLLFRTDGTLLATLGDRGMRQQAQDLSTHQGSVIRVLDDGRAPADNPFIGTEDALPEIYSYGHRNIQGIAIQPGTGDIWSHEHGPQGGDEVNILQAGANYGWPVITHGRNYGLGTKIGEGTHKEGMVQPISYWVPSIAPSGMAFYDGTEFPNWRGDIFVGSLKFGLLVRLEVDGAEITREERMFGGRFGRIRDVRNGPDGFLYVLTDEYDGKLLRLRPADSEENVSKKTNPFGIKP